MNRRDQFSRSDTKDQQEEDYFNAVDEESPGNKQSYNKSDEDSDEVDPLDAFMEDCEQEALHDLKETYEKTLALKKEPLTTLYEEIPSAKQEDEFMDENDPTAEYMEAFKQKERQKAIGMHLKSKFVEQGYGGEEFVDDEGELDYQAIHEAKKKKKFTDIEELDHKKIKYNRVKNNFYEEHEDVSNLTEKEVAELR